MLELAPVLRKEINVKEIEVVSEVGELVNYKLMPNNRVLGPKFGKQFPKVRQALMALDPAQAARTLQAGKPLALTVDGETVMLTDDDCGADTVSTTTTISNVPPEIVTLDATSVEFAAPAEVPTPNPPTAGPVGG